MKQILSLLLLCSVYCTGCATTGSRSWVSGMPTFWKAAPKTDQNGNTITKQGWFKSGTNQFGAEDATVAEAAPIIPQKLFNRKSAEQEKQTRIADQLALGNSHEQANQWEKARKLYEQLGKDYPESAKVRHRLAVVNDRTKRHTEAQRLYQEAIQLDPENPELLNDLGYSYFLQGQLDKAEATLASAVKMSPHTTRYHNNLGMVYGHQGKHQKALRGFREAGSDADSYFNLAFVYAAQEKTEEAKACFQKALAADPSHAKSREALASFDRYERTPPELRDDSDSLENDKNTRWVAFVEGAEKGESEVVPATATSTTDSKVQAAGGLKSISSNRYAAEQSRRLQSSAKPMQDMHYRGKRAAEGVPYTP